MKLKYRQKTDHVGMKNNFLRNELFIPLFFGRDGTQRYYLYHLCRMAYRESIMADLNENQKPCYTASLKKKR